MHKWHYIEPRIKLVLAMTSGEVPSMEAISIDYDVGRALQIR